MHMVEIGIQSQLYMRRKGLQLLRRQMQSDLGSGQKSRLEAWNNWITGVCAVEMGARYKNNLTEPACSEVFLEGEAPTWWKTGTVPCVMFKRHYNKRI